MAFDTELTGKTRYRTGLTGVFNKKEIIVLQVEETYWWDRGFPHDVDMKQDKRWRDARLEDLNIVFKEA